MKKYNKQPEYDFCVDFISIVDSLQAMNQALKPFMILHIANEHKGTQASGGRRKKMGVRSGVLDYLVIWEDGYGFIEAKCQKGLYGSDKTTYLNENQRTFVDFLKVISANNATIRTVNEGLETLCDWGLLPKECYVLH